MSYQLSAMSHQQYNPDVYSPDIRMQLLPFDLKFDLLCKISNSNLSWEFPQHRIPQQHLEQ
jgi:hypothetical protein